MKAELSRKEEDYLRLLASNAHIGTKNLNHQMKRYVDHRGAEGIYILKLEETW